MGRDTALFGFLEECRTLKPDKEIPNWLSWFSNSCDIKAILQKHYDKVVLPQRLADAMYDGTFPFFSVKVNVEESGGIAQFARITATNVGSATALNTRIYFGNLKSKADNLEYCIASNQSIEKDLPLSKIPLSYEVLQLAEEPLFIEFESTLGIRVVEEYVIEAFLPSPQSIAVNVRPKPRRFIRGRLPIFTIDDEQDPNASPQPVP